MLRLLISTLLLSLATVPARADDPEIVKAVAERVGMGWRIDVTLQHPDTGWDHFADGWEILDADGNRLGYRELMHPHVHEQPFTRALVNVMLPDGIREIHIRARCSEAGWASDTVTLALKN